LKKKVILIFILFISIFIVASCNKKESKEETSYSKIFKEEYEELNNKETKYGSTYRSISIDEDNPFEKVTADEIVEKIENNEEFYLYIGDKYCPWCRSVIEKFIEVAKNNNINKVYYVNIWDDDINEILRDKYELVDNVPTKTKDGTKSYYKLLEYFDSVLEDYTLTNDNNEEIQVGEKRIYAPNFFHYTKDNIKFTTGISDKQEDSNQELTNEILEDEENKFQVFFS